MALDPAQRLLYELTRSRARAGMLNAEGYSPAEQSMARAKVEADLNAERQVGQCPGRDTQR